MSEPVGRVHPSPKQVAQLRAFIDGRTYTAVGFAVRLPDDPPVVPGSGLARTREVNGAFFSLVLHLCQSLQVELQTDPQGPVATALWDALIRAARPWVGEPDLPAELREVLPSHDLNGTG